ncbi:MAG TPA: hypothetical protein GXZ22_05155 [Clostridiaceae bacterium]|jgi:hypothetical protein|nr:hypothetical protein [Clostridiaceae bacterium]
MGRIREKIIRFMYGRYGIDQLYYALLVVCFILMLVNSFIRLAVFDILIWAILVLMVYRALSRNIYKRQIENQKFLKVWNPIKSKFSLLIRRLKEIQTHRYRKCLHCKAILRLPKRKGRHTVNCPRCHRDFDVHIAI